jgi:hypothetical protein
MKYWVGVRILVVEQLYWQAMSFVEMQHMECATRALLVRYFLTAMVGERD